MGSLGSFAGSMFATKGRAIAASALLAFAAAALLILTGLAQAQNGTFANNAAISIPGSNTSGHAAPYPSTIGVSGMTGNVTDVDVTLTGVTHTNPDDIDVLLVGPIGQNVRLMSDTGGGNPISNVNLTLDDEAASGLADSMQISSGTYKPSNFGSPVDNFSGSGASEPAPGYGANLSVFDGADPNGDWKLYVVDDFSSNTGQISNGWSIKVSTNNDPPEITGVIGGTANEGSPATIAVAATDPQNDTLAYSFDCNNDSDYADTGDTAGQPGNEGSCTFDDNGQKTVGVKVSDGKANGADTDSATVTVNNAPPTAGFGNGGAINEGGAATVTFSNASDPSTADTNAGFRYEYRCDGSAFPGDPEYDGASTTDSATCDFAQDGEKEILARIIDKDDGATPYTTRVTVNNVSPTISNIEDRAINENADTGEISFTVGDVDGDTLTVTGESSDTDLVQEDNIAISETGANRTVKVTPVENENGEATITLTSSDGDGGTASEEFTVTVRPVNARPNAISVTPAVVDEADTGNEVEINLSDAVDDVETANADLMYDIADPTTEQGTLEPKMDSGSPVPGVFIFDPAQNYNTGTGTLDLSYTVTDRGDPDDCDDTAPENNLDGCDSAKDASSTVSITVNPKNDAPVANDDPGANDTNVRYTVAEDNLLTVADGANDILANDTDVDEDELSVADSDIGAEGIQPENGPSNGTLELDENGSFTYAPNADYNGFDSFTYKATDGADESANTATVRINVTAENDPPVAGDDGPVSLDEDGSQPIGVLANDTDADNGSEDLSVVGASISAPDHGTATLIDESGVNEGGILYTPDEDYNGSDSFTYKVSDGTDESDQSATVSISVGAVNDEPGFTAEGDEDVLEDSKFPDEMTQEARNHEVENWITAFDPDATGEDGQGNDSESSQTIEDYLITDVTNDDLFEEQPDVTNDGTLTYTLAENANGSADFSVAVQDDGGAENPGDDDASDPETFTITVNADNDAPTLALANDPDQSVEEDSTGPDDEAGSRKHTVTDFAAGTPGGGADEGGQSVSFEVVAVDDSGDPISGGSPLFAAQPAIDEDGTLTYTLAGDANGAATIRVAAKDDGTPNASSDSETFTISVVPVNDAPTARDADRTVDEDDILEVNVFDDAISDADDDKISSDTEVDRGEDGATLTLINATQGEHGTVRCTPNGACTYTPDENYNGDDSLEYTVRDSNSGLATGRISISVASVDDDPIANDDPSEGDDTLETNRGESLENIDVLENDTDSDGDTISIFDFTQPMDENGDSAGTLTKNNDDTFTFAPDANFFGTATFTYRAKDFRGTDENDPEPDGISDESATVTITVIDDNEPPVAVNDEYSVDEGATLTADGTSDNPNGVLANDTDEDDLFVADADPTEDGVQPESGPENGMLELAEDGTFTYTPNGDFYGADEFTYNATDRRGNDDPSEPATVAITVNNIEDNPVANNDPGNDGAYEVNEDGALSVNAGGGLIANDADADNLTGNPNTGLTVADSSAASGIQPESGPSRGSLTLNANGSFTYTPNADYNGPDSFTYKAKDAEGNLSDDTATGSISVSPVADAPIARLDNGATATTEEDTPFLINVLANDGNPDGGPLTVTVADGPDHGTASVTTEDGADKNKIQYTPNENFHGSDDLTYEVCDSGNRCDQAQARITVSPVNDAPIANDDSYATDDDETLSVNAADGLLANDTDVDNDGNSNAGLRVFQPGQPTYGNLTANEDGSLEYAFDPESADDDFTGTDSFTYTVKDGGDTESQPATVTIEINTVNKKPTAAGDEYTVLEDGTLAADGAGDPAINGVLFNDTDPENDSLTAQLADSVSDGQLTFDTTDGTFDYEPSEHFNGTDSFTYRADDGGSKNNLSGEATVSITVAPENDIPAADSASRATDEDGDNVSIDLSSLVDDIETPNGELDYELTAANGATLSGSILTYNPADDFNTGGGDPVEIEYTVADKGDPNDCDDADENCDGAAKTAENTVNITVRPVNDRPVAGDKSDATTPEDTPFAIDVFEGAPPLATDTEVSRSEPGASLAVVRTTNGEHGDVSRDGSALTYTPDADYNGGDSFTYTVRDDAGEEATGTISVSVSGVNKPPTATADSFTVAEDGTLTGNVLTNDTDSDGDALTAELVEGPENAAETNGFTLNPNGSFTYKPKPNFHGSDSFSYEACDAGEPCAEATVSITITPVNDAPVANNDPSNDTSYEATEDGALTVDDGGNDVLANDTDADGDELSAAKVSNPSHGTVTLNSDGSFTYTPSGQYNGTDSFTYRANDGSLSSEVAVVSITVSAVNDKPVPTDDAKSTPENTPLVFPASQLTANDKPGPAAAGDEQSQTLTVTEVGSSEHGAASLDNGEITFTPAPNYNGPASFEYTVCDDGSPQACAVMEATVNVAISAVNSAPVAGSISRTMDEGDAPITVNLADHTSDDETADGDLQFEITEGPTSAQGAATLDGSNLTFTPNPNFDGTVNLRYSVTDDGDGEAPAKTTEASLTVTVNSVNDAPTAGDVSATTREDTPANINVLAEAADSDGDDLEVIIVSQPGKGSAAVNGDGTVRYSPRTNLNGADSFTYKVSDGELESGEATVSIAITAVNDAPSAASDTARTTINRAVSVNVLANDSDPDGDNLSATVAGQPAKGKVVKNSNGALKYTPPRNFVGTVSFTYRASDGNGGASVATVRITVARR